jgi:hypothetical protein
MQVSMPGGAVFICCAMVGDIPVGPSNSFTEEPFAVAFCITKT